MNHRTHIEALGHLLTWYAEDLAFFNTFRQYAHGEIDLDAYKKSTASFQKFVNKYRVARNFEAGETALVLDICMDWYRTGQWKDTDVDDLANRLMNRGNLTREKLTVSLASKAMFLMRPDLVLPYDIRARKTLGYRKNNYAGFFEKALAFEKQHILLLDGILDRASDWLDELERPFVGQIDKLPIIRRRRLLDKLLWVGV